MEIETQGAPAQLLQATPDAPNTEPLSGTALEYYQPALFTLMEEANREVEAAETAFGSWLQHAIRAGELLAQQKAMLPHGQWLPWLADNFCRSRQSAAGYMKLSAHKDALSNVQSSGHLSIDAALKMLALSGDAAGEALPHVAHNSGENEWYTPREFIALAREVMGEIDLDPASSEAANAVVQAKRFYSIGDDGLAQTWTGRVWMNPPYAAELIGQFTAKLQFHFVNGDVPEAIVLVNNATETRWFQSLAACASAICFREKRVSFWSPAGVPGAPLQGQAFLYLGLEPEPFISAFAPIGLVTEVRCG